MLSSANSRTSHAVDFLLGRSNDLPLSYPLGQLWQRSRAPRLGSPPAYYLGQIHQFCYGGGLQLAGLESVDYDPASLQELHALLRTLNRELDLITERVSVTGSVVGVVRVDEGDPSPHLSLYDNCHYHLDGTELNTRYRTPKGKWGKTVYTDTEILVYPEHNNPDRPPKTPDTVTPHPYGRLWAEIGSGEPGFDDATVELMLALGLQRAFAGEHFSFLSDPILVVPDVEEAEGALRRRKRVIRSSEKDLHPPEVLQMGGSGGDWAAYREELHQAFCERMGISYIPPGTGVVTGPPMYILNAKTIRKAESLRDEWDPGINALYQTLWRVARITGACGIEPIPEQRLERAQPYFPSTAADLQQGVATAGQLRDLGIDPAIALHLTALPHLPIETIRDMIKGDPNYA